LQERLEAAQKLNSLWRGKIYAPLLQQPFSADAISALPKGIKLLQRSADSMQKLAAAVESCEPNSKRSLAPNVAAQQKFLQGLQQRWWLTSCGLGTAESRMPLMCALDASALGPVVLC
jgi:hypothetical protein